MKKKTRLTIILVNSVIYTLFFSFSITFGWILSGYSQTPSITGHAAASYYASGTGTAEDPYIIKNRIHLYNLAWLQYLGEYNTNTVSATDSDGNSVTRYQQFYFELGADINMEGMILPPIGTAKYPFIGNFNGNGYTVYNLGVSNTTSSSDLNYITQKPYTISSISDCDFIGFFGVVGKYGTKGYNNSSEGSSDITIDTSVNSISNFYLDYINVSTCPILDTNSDGTPETAVGVVAGYVDASISNIGVYRASFTVKSSAFGCANIFTDATGTVSQYGLIGYSVQSDSGDTGGGTGEENDFGGSIDFSLLMKRLNLLGKQSDSSIALSSDFTFSSSISHVSCYNSYGIYYLYEPNSLATYMPLNVDDDKLTTSVYTSADIVEPVLDSNTGYIVSGGTSTTNGYIRIRSRNFSYIQNSLKNNTSFSSTNFEIITYDYSQDKMVVIKDDKYITTDDSWLGENNSNIDATTVHYSTLNFTKYMDVREKIQTTFSNVTQMSGIRFYVTSSSNGITESNGTYTATDTLEVSDITLDGKTINALNTFELIKGGINFTLKRSGVLTALIGSTDTSNTNYQVPYLYKIDRTQDNKISTITKIESSYVNSNGSPIINPDSTTGLTKRFDATKFTSLMVYKVMAYIEIPLPAGDYYISRSTVNTSTPYFFYLDIGANLNEVVDEEETFPYTNVDYVSSIPTLGEADSNGLVREFVSYSDVAIRLVKSGSTKNTIIYFKRVSDTAVYYFIVDEDGNYCDDHYTVTGIPESLGYVINYYTAISTSLWSDASYSISNIDYLGS